jgi:hypothetical protein
VVNPDIARSLNRKSITVSREHVLADDVTDDDIALLPYEEANTAEFWKLLVLLLYIGSQRRVLAPGRPMIDLLEPILT